MFAIHDASFLYLAYDVILDTLASDSAEAVVCLDDDASGSWPPQDTTEGVNRLINPDTWLCAWFRQDFTSGEWHDSGLSSLAFGESSGHATLELAIPMVLLDVGPQFLGANPVPDGDSVGVHVYYDDPLLGKVACWPQDVSVFYNPAQYGVFYLEPFSSVGESAGKTGPSLLAASVVRGKAELSLVLPGKAGVSLALYDATGRLAKRLFEGEMGAGVHRFSLEFPGSGVYFLVARAGDWSGRVKMVSVE